MRTSEARLKLWGRFIRHNQLLDDDRLRACLKAYRGSSEDVAFDRFLLDNGYLSERYVTQIRKRIDQIVAQSQERAGPQAQQSEERTTGSDAAEAPLPSAASSPAQEQSADASVPLAEEDADSAAARPDKLEWSSELAEETGGASSAHYQPEHEKIVIDLEGPDEADEEEAVAEASPAAASAGDAPAEEAAGPAESAPDASGRPRSARAEAAAEAPDAAAPESESDPDRVESPVAPHDVDTEAIKVLKQAVKLGASDIHFVGGCAPFCRLHGKLSFFKLEKLGAERARHIALGFMDDDQQQRFLRHGDLDFSYDAPELGRFRVNALEHFRGASIIFRHIPKEIPTLDSLGLPEEVGKLTEWSQGLVLVTGPAGSGKTTTAAAMIGIVNESRKDHVITVEDPVEFVHPSRGCNITQRQVPVHTESFSSALKGALREDPDVIMIGEMRDLETVSLALRAAETGHLVIGTLQTKSAARTIDRVVDVFPSDQQPQIRAMLAESLRGVVSQQLVPRADGKGRVAALELLYVTRAISNLIRDGKTFQLPSQMQTQAKVGTRLLDDSLEKLAEAGTITRESAARVAENPKRFAAPPEPAAEEAEEAEETGGSRGWFKRR